MYIYEGHTGGLYCSEFLFDYEDLHCETCGDTDRERGHANSQKELLRLLANDIQLTPEEGGYKFDYILELAHSWFPDEPKIGRKKAKAIILKYRVGAEPS